MGRVGMARRLIVAAPIVAVLLTSCTSTGFLGFLATTKQVDAKLSTQQDQTQKNIDQIDSDIKTLQADVSKFNDQTAQINALLQQTQQLQKLASTVEGRLASLPRDTLLQLSDLIQKALNTGSASSPAAAPAK